MSLDRNDYQFLLRPWEYPGAHFDLRPDAVATWEVRGRERLFLLKAREGRVYFRQPGRAKVEWALTQLMPGSETDIVEFWREQLQQGNFGRYAVFVRGYDATFTPAEIQELFGHQLHRDFDVCTMNVLQRTVVSFVVRADGAVWAREWCSETWVELPPKPGIFEDEADAIWNPANQLKGLRQRCREVGKALALQPVKLGAQRSTPLPVRWGRGSRAEMLQVLRWWFVAARIEPGVGPVRLTLPTKLPLAPESQVRSEWGEHCESNHPLLRSATYFPPVQLILDWYMPVRVGDYASEPVIRMKWGFRRLPTSVTLTLPVEPSEFERAKALRMLSAWLEGKVSQRERKRILGLWRA